MVYEDTKISERKCHDVVVHDEAIANVKNGFFTDFKAQFEVEVFGLGCAKLGTRSAYYTIPQGFSGGQVGYARCQLVWVINQILDKSQIMYSY